MKSALLWVLKPESQLWFPVRPNNNSSRQSGRNNRISLPAGSSWSPQEQSDATFPFPSSWGTQQKEEGLGARFTSAFLSLALTIKLEPRSTWSLVHWFSDLLCFVYFPNGRAPPPPRLLLYLKHNLCFAIKHAGKWLGHLSVPNSLLCSSCRQVQRCSDKAGLKWESRLYWNMIRSAQLLRKEPNLPLGDC